MLKREAVKEGEWVGQKLLPWSAALGKAEWTNPIHKSSHQNPHAEWIKSIQKFLNTKVMCPPYSTNVLLHGSDVDEWKGKTRGLWLVSQSEFVLFCATNCELPPLKQQTLFVCFLNRINLCLCYVSEVFFLLCHFSGRVNNSWGKSYRMG